MSSYKDYKKRALQNPEVKAEYDALQPEYDIIQAMIDARVQQNMTQKDLSAKTERAAEQIPAARCLYLFVNFFLNVTANTENDKTSKIMKGMTAAESPVATVLAGFLLPDGF